MSAFIGMARAVQTALEKALGKPKEIMVVDVDTKMAEAGLSALFPIETWPPTFAVCFTVSLH